MQPAPLDFVMATDAWRDRVYGCARSNGYLQIAQGLLPPPVDLGGNRRAFLRREIDAVNAARAAGATAEQLRGLVRQLIEARRTALAGMGISLEGPAQRAEAVAQSTGKATAARVGRRQSVATA